MTGWECPKCGRCYSPGVVMCHYCGQESSRSTGTLTIRPDTTTAPPLSNTLPAYPADHFGPHGGLCACPQCAPRVTCSAPSPNQCAVGAQG